MVDLPSPDFTAEQKELPSFANSNSGTMYSDEAPWNKGNLKKRIIKNKIFYNFIINVN